jgi:hypothetical protein
MELNKEMSASESLAIITETMNNSRKSILRRSGKYTLVWGIALTIVSLLVFFCWKTTGRAASNYLWFAMPLVGGIPSVIMKKKEGVALPDNYVSRILSGIWRSFGVFAIGVSVFTLLFVQFSDSALMEIALAVGLSPMILLLFGMAETISGVAVKNWIIKVAGFVTGIGGLVLYYLMDSESGVESTLLFTLAGVVLAISGVLVQIQNKQ